MVRARQSESVARLALMRSWNRDLSARGGARPWNTRFWRRCRQASWPFRAERRLLQSRCVGMFGRAEVDSKSFRISTRPVSGRGSEAWEGATGQGGPPRHPPFPQRSFRHNTRGNSNLLHSSRTCTTECCIDVQTAFLPSSWRSRCEGNRHTTTAAPPLHDS